MSVDQPLRTDALDPQFDNTDNGPESGNEEVDALKKLIESKDAEKINAELDDNFLENLKDGLHPDTAKDLKDAIEHINGFNTEGTDLNRLYKYVSSICDAFDTEENKDNDHETIQTKFDVNELVDQRVKERILQAVNFVEYKNIIIGDEKITSILSATKGILNGGELSGGVIVKMAEFLGISTKENDDKYNRQGRLNRLGKKVFAMDNDNGLFRWLSNKYESMTKDSEEMKKFLENPLTKMSLIKPDWKGGEISKDDESVTKFCGTWKLTAEDFVNSFNEKNNERINKNKEGLKKIDITTKFDISKAEIDESGALKYNQDGTKVLLNADKLVSLVSISASDVEGGNFVSNEELQNTIKDNSNPETSVTKARLDKIKKVINERPTEPEPEPESEQQTQLESLESKDAIKVKLFKINADEIIGTISSAKDLISDENKDALTGKINDVINALRVPGKAVNGSGSESIQKLQKTIQETLKLNPKINPDGKLGRNTLFAIKEYLGVATQGEKLRYETNRAKLGSTLNKVLEGFDNLESLQKSLGDSSDDLDALQAKAQEYIENPLSYVKDKLEESGCKIAGRTKILDILKTKDEGNMKLLQLSLLPNYKGNIDGKIGPLTTKALQDYIEKSDNNNGDENTINSMIAHDSSDIANINREGEALKNSFVSIEKTEGKTAYFFDGSKFNYTVDGDNITGTFLQSPQNVNIKGEIEFNKSSKKGKQKTNELEIEIEDDRHAAYNNLCALVERI